MINNYFIFVVLILSISLTLTILSDGSTKAYSQQIDWKNYTNGKLGVSFEYPSNWVIYEKQNRFEEGPEINVDNGSNSFKFGTAPFPVENVIKLLGFKTGVSKIANAIPEGEGRIIEGIDFNKYKIDGKETGSFLVVSYYENGIELPIEWFYINNGTNVLMAGYSNTLDQFDSPSSQSIKNHILGSIKFLS